MLNYEKLTHMEYSKSLMSLNKAVIKMLQIEIDYFFDLWSAIIADQRQKTVTQSVLTSAGFSLKKARCQLRPNLTLIDPCQQSMSKKYPKTIKIGLFFTIFAIFSIWSAIFTDQLIYCELTGP